MQFKELRQEHTRNGCFARAIRTAENDNLFHD
jgi:hypothetical protein